jgi:FAD synthase
VCLIWYKGRTDPKQTTMKDIVFSNNLLRFTIHSRDALQNAQIKDESKQFKVTLTASSLKNDSQNNQNKLNSETNQLPISPQFTYQQNGIYSVAIQSNFVGTVQLRVTFNDSDINGSPLTLTFQSNGNSVVFFMLQIHMRY